MRNLHKLFYKDYFSNVGFSLVEEQKKTIVKATNKPTNDKLLNAEYHKIDCIESVTHSFPLKTVYPGLITGVGIDHEAGIEGEFKLGVHFDYTWGMPVIYGSSVKGVLRTYFKDFAKEHFPNVDIEDLFMDIFEGKIRNRQKDKNENGKLIKGYDNKSIYNRDIFFDAVIVAKNSKGKMLDSDTLCPHGDNPLKNPNPISFLKIASGVTIEFRFKLVKSIIGEETVCEQKKLDIFKNILTTVGIGAKTNVGYGQFTDPCNDRKK